MVATVDPHRRDYFKPDFFNGIGQDDAFPPLTLEHPVSVQLADIGRDARERVRCAEHFNSQNDSF